MKNGAKMFKAVQLMRRKIAMKPVIYVEDGRIVGNDKDAA